MRPLFGKRGSVHADFPLRWQDRLDPLWWRVNGGRHLNRKIDDLISSNGFRIDALANARLPGPRTHTFLYEGRAQPL
jgi:hypothetical protein